MTAQPKFCESNCLDLTAIKHWHIGPIALNVV